MGRGGVTTQAREQLLFGPRSLGRGPRPARRPDATTRSAMMALAPEVFSAAMEAVYVYEGREPGWQEGLRQACAKLNTLTELQGLRGEFYYLDDAPSMGQSEGMTAYRSPLLAEPIMVHIAGCFDAGQIADTVIRVRDRERSAHSPKA